MRLSWAAAVRRQGTAWRRCWRGRRSGTRWESAWAWPALTSRPPSSPGISRRSKACSWPACRCARIRSWAIVCASGQLGRHAWNPPRGGSGHVPGRHSSVYTCCWQQQCLLAPCMVMWTCGSPPGRLCRPSRQLGHQAVTLHAVQGGAQGQAFSSRVLTAQALWVVGANAQSLPSQLWGECLQVRI